MKKIKTLAYFEQTEAHKYIETLEGRSSFWHRNSVPVLPHFYAMQLIAQTLEGLQEDNRK